MAVSKFQKKQYINPITVIKVEQALIKKHFSFMNCKITQNTLHCYGYFKPTNHSNTFEYVIKYNGISSPSVFVITPEIKYNDDIHMYPKDNSLCLYHKSDMRWSNSKHIFNTIIPWTHEWFTFYELYNITGEWLHPFVPHKRNEKVK